MMSRYRITYSAPHGTEREIIEAESLQDADRIATERMFDAWFDKCWSFAKKITEAAEKPRRTKITIDKYTPTMAFKCPQCRGNLDNLGDKYHCDPCDLDVQLVMEMIA